MNNPEGKPGKRSAEEMTRFIAETGEKLHKIFRERYHEADIQGALISKYMGYMGQNPVTPAGAVREANIEIWRANAILAGAADKATLERALVCLDTAIAINNYPPYRQCAQIILDRLNEMK